jgi:hypothetical protein
LLYFNSNTWISLNPMSPGVQTNGRARLTESPKGGALDQTRERFNTVSRYRHKLEQLLHANNTGSLFDLLAGASRIRPTS